MNWAPLARLRQDPILSFVLAAVAVVAVVCAVAFVTLDARFERVLDARDSRAVELELRLLREIDREEGRDALVRALNRRVDAFGDGAEVFALVDSSGRLVVGSIDYPEGFVPDSRWRPFYDTGKVDPAGFARAARLRDGAVVLAGVDFSDRKAARDALALTFAFAIGAVLVAALGVGAVVNRLILARIDQVVATSQRIMGGDLDERVPTDGAGGPFDQLAGALNAMLERIGALITQMRAVTDAIAHDLRAPLQRIRGGLERAASVEDPAALRAAVTRAVEETDEALTTFDLLLEIARAQSGVGRDSFEPVEIGPLIADVAELFEPFAEERGVTLSAAPVDAAAPGNSVLLRQAIGNLVHNAIKYVRPGGHIRISAYGDALTLSVVVEDDGPGIPAEKIDGVLQPFGRLERDRDEDGKGLGLSLVAACAKLHGGRLALEDARPGLRATLSLPRG